MGGGDEESGDGGSGKRSGSGCSEPLSEHMSPSWHVSSNGLI